MKVAIDEKSNPFSLSGKVEFIMSARKLRPTGTNVLFEPHAAEEQSKGGIMMPIAYQQPSTMGTVIAVGGKCEHVQAGQNIIFSWINARDVEHDGRLVKLIPEALVLGVVE